MALKGWTLRLHYPPSREVASAPGDHNISHVFGDFSIRSLQVILEVFVTVATGTAQFIGQGTAGDDGNLLRTGVGDPHSGSDIDGHSVPCELDGKLISHFAGKGFSLAVYLNETKKRTQEINHE